MQSDAPEIAQRLARAAPSLCADLFPYGKREGAEFRIGNLAGTPGRSLSIRLFGAKAGVWADFASGQGGDLLDLVAQARFAGNLKAAIGWASAWLGLPTQGSARAPLPQPAAPQPAQGAAADADALARQRAARAIFAAAQPSIADTPAEHYLRARGIDLRALGRQPAALRFHPALRNTETGRQLPALVAAITGPDGTLQAVHRTFLALDDAGVWRKASLAVPKSSLGPVGGGLIRLWRGCRRRGLADAAPDETLLLGEGIETCLSAVCAAPEMRVASAVSLANLGRVELPPAVRHVIVLGENDDNDAARRALHAAVQRLAAAGRSIRIARPPTNCKDFNDVLRGAQAVTP